MRFAVLGDLHYEAQDTAIFEAARRQLLAQRPEAVVSLGDLGGYSHCGTALSFTEGREYFSGFKVPFWALIGNHDLEGLDEFASDEDSVRGFTKAFALPAPWQAFDLGDALGITLSSTRFRGNTGCPHEVFLGAEQLAWFEATLERHRARPIFVFSHCPPLGSRLRVILNLHLNFANAWLDHNEEPARYLEIAKRHPQIRLWFSGHNHLGQLYRDSLSQVGACVFAHVGVMSRVTRDGSRMSRVVDHSGENILLYSLDHDTGQLIHDGSFDLERSELQRHVRPVELIGTAHPSAPRFEDIPHDLAIGDSVFYKCGETLVEYDRVLQDALGVVADHTKDRRVILDGEQLFLSGTWGRRQACPRRPDGRFYRPLPFELPRRKKAPEG